MNNLLQITAPLESCTGNPLIYVAEHWWQIALMIVGCVFTISIAHVLKLNRPWPLAVILGGTLAWLFLEGYPCPWVHFGKPIIVLLWVVMTGMVYFLPDTVPQPSTPDASTYIWDYFEEIDDSHPYHTVSEKGDFLWDE